MGSGHAVNWKAYFGPLISSASFSMSCTIAEMGSFQLSGAILRAQPPTLVPSTPITPQKLTEQTYVHISNGYLPSELVKLRFH